MTLELQTDSSYLDLRFEILSSCRTFFGIDVEVDDILSNTVRVEQHQGLYEGRLYEGMPGVTRDIRIHLPHTVEVRLLEVGLEDGACVEPLPRRPRTLLALGDSITQGMESPSPFSGYPVQLARLLDAELLNQGVGGHIVDAGSLDPDLPCRPDLVTVAYGTNDWRQKACEPFRLDVRDYLTRLRSMFPAERTRIAVLSPIWRVGGTEKRHGVDLPDFSRILLEEAARLPATTAIDGLRLVPNQPACLADSVHPNETGFLHYALNLYRLLTAQSTGWTAPAVA